MHACMELDLLPADQAGCWEICSPQNSADELDWLVRIIKFNYKFTYYWDIVIMQEKDSIGAQVYSYSGKFIDNIIKLSAPVNTTILCQVRHARNYSK